MTARARWPRVVGLGKTWSEPVNTGIWGYPAHLLRLPGGRLLATYGYRRAPMGIRACLSRDGGRRRLGRLVGRCRFDSLSVNTARRTQETEIASVRMLAVGYLNHRQIAPEVCVSINFVAQIAIGERTAVSTLRPVLSDGERFVPESVRCGQCGRRVYVVPCRACRAEGWVRLV